MDSACLNLDSVPTTENHSNEFIAVDSQSKKDDSGEPVSAISKSGRSKFLKETTQSAMHGLNKFTSQIKKPTRRKVSPIKWFPRKNMDSYLKRKIKMLQEVDGLNLTLDETLGDSNPHYSRVLKEKMAVREAAHKAMKARKAALVEASWCRILRAARIQCKEAEEKMYEAEKAAAEAFEAAAAMGVIMYDTPNCPQKTYKMETSSSCGGGSTTHTITTSFETEFEVDKEVAAAVKTALVRLASCSSLREDDFKELLRKISQNPECDTNVAPLEISSECESENVSELDQAPRKSDFSSHILDCKMLDLHMRQTTSEKETKIEDLMHERLRGLKEEELSSLATIVATCGLNAALAEVGNGKVHDANSSAVPSFVSSLNLPRRMSSATNLHNGRKQVESELPSLDKFLVKHVTKLEREVLEAKNSRKNKEKELGLDTSKTTTIEEKVDFQDEKVAPSLETMQTKPPSSEVVEEKTRNKKLQARQTFVSHKEVVSAFPSLDKYLVKHVSRLEKEVQEAKNRRKLEPLQPPSEESLMETKGKENVNMPRNMEDSLDKILVKPVHRLEREKMMAVLAESNYNNQRQNKKQLDNHTSDCQSLDEIFVKHVSRLEKEKMRSKPENNLKRSEKKFHSVVNGGGDGGGLGEILVKHKSRLEREKLLCSQESENENKSFQTRREAREKDDLQSAWGGLSLGDSMRPRLSKLERDKAAWIKAEEEERKQILSEI
ncbi:hypothetical protein IC582_017525 [Cucumis melo]|uniref:Uncharacterized protein LOC103494795 n=2 Tax=Cucumis melo TaxID=3656 RepID=A0A1S3BXZ4_CUCME|nr:uncharacterized protein LOC103494795 [Cucumis melo]KAA0044352.1 uncharacterized protein E6C27_scaffold46G00780 [Cucumis melo var. makuwa]TYK29481.1 uncharacterized protein E5676_scaffold655G00790 [Cucumis melo var. makuwa]